MQKNNKKTKTFKLNNFEKLQRISSMEGLNMSEMIDFLIENYELGLKPHEKLKKLQNDREQLREKLEGIDKKISRTNEEIALNEEWKEKSNEKKQIAIDSISRAIIQGRTDDAQRFAKNQATITGVPASELLVEANKKAKFK